MTKDREGCKLLSVPGGYAVYSEYNKWVSPTQPILCTGFEGSLKQIAHLFNWFEGYAD